jgi:hypothetical protein
MASPGRQDDVAVSSSVIAFLIAGVLFMASVTAVLVTTRQSAEEGVGDSTDAARFDIQSSALADILFESPGYSSDAASYTTGLIPDWTEDAVTYSGYTTKADSLQRLGLLDADSSLPGMLDYAKFQNLRRAGYYAAADGYVNYEEAVETLGLSDAALDFHIRAYPSLVDLATLLAAGDRDPNLRVTYIGDITVSTATYTEESELTEGLTMTAPTCSTDASRPRMYLIKTDVHNGGSQATQFTAVTYVDLGSGKTQEQNVNSYLVPADTTVTLTAEVAALSGRACSASSMATFDLYDPVHSKLMSSGDAACGTSCPADAITAVAAPLAAEIGLYIDTDKQNYRPTEAITLNFDGTGLKNNDDLFLRVCPGTTECATGSAGSWAYNSGFVFNAPANNARKLTIPASTLAAGEYTAWLYDCEYNSKCGSTSSAAAPAANQLRATEKILVTAAAVEGYLPDASVIEGPTTYTAGDNQEREILFLEMLIEKFCPSWFDSKAESPLSDVSNPWDAADWTSRCASFKDAGAGLPTGQWGDVFPDSKKVMNEDLPSRLTFPDGTPRYDYVNVLVVGSGVDHNAMTSESAKGAIRDWVFGGGTIVVFGSDDGNVNWLQPLFHSAIRGGGETISTPDQGHPMLHVPNELDNPGENYDARNSVWRFNGQTAQAQDSSTPVFSNVIVADNVDPLLAVSNRGSFGAGSIIITAYQPWDLYNDGAGGPSDLTSTECAGQTVAFCEGLMFMQNMLMQGYADLFLEYGPAIPDGTDVEPSIRLAQIIHPDLGAIDMTMIVYVF